MLRNYLLTAYKVFMRRKLFTAINLACIVLTLVVLMVITSLLDTAFHPRGVEGKSDRFVEVMLLRMVGPGGHHQTVTPLGYKLVDKYLKPLPGVERVAALTMPDTVSVYQGDRVSALLMRRVDADYWKVLDFTLLAGRLPTAGDDAAGRAIAVVNQSSARKLFPGPAAGAVGRSIDIGGRGYRIVGVVRDEMHLNAYSDIWAPISTLESGDYRNQLTGPFAALILAHDAADLPRVRREVARIGARLPLEDPRTWNRAYLWADSKLDLFARILLQHNEQADSGAGTLVALIAGAMLLFMLLPALNLVNLNTGRIIERHSEIGVRKAFGATGAQLAAQLVVENVLLSLAGGVIGLAATAAALWWLEQLQLIPYLRLDLNLAVFAWGMLIACVFGLVSGVIPAWKMSRLDPVHALKGAV